MRAQLCRTHARRRASRKLANPDEEDVRKREFVDGKPELYITPRSEKSLNSSAPECYMHRYQALIPEWKEFIGYTT
ncbi:hypothetical protein chiPu_0014350 [Chiloscyllium punctatum]|uniref:Uncharacterized protein n=1 Tax=Chiloscyllium punctatum TaxID=137246 RepID=A0A401SZN9_CHIPU|nr:hypothetical protein [Chiloscyllium punctatum]